jgi:hypothetical protein
MSTNIIFVLMYHRHKLLDPIYMNRVYSIHFASILISLFHLRLFLPSGVFPSGFQNKISYATSPCVLHAPSI